MAQPITWQNVNQGDASTAWRGLDSAHRTLNGAFDALNGVVKNSEATDDANWQTIKTNNTNADLNAINQYATPEAYAEAQKNGAIAALISAHGAQVDQAALRQAADNRLSTLQQRATQGITYQNTATDQAQQPLMDQIQGYLKSGDPKLMQQGKDLLAAHQELRLKAGLYGDINMGERQLVERGQHDTKFADDLKTSDNQRRASMISALASQTSAGASVESAHAATNNAKTNAQSLLVTLQKDAEDRQFKAGAGLASINSHLLGSNEGGAEIVKTIQAIKDDDVRAAAGRIVEKLPRDAKASDVNNLIQTIMKPGFWGTLGGKSTSDSEILAAFKPIYDASKADKSQQDALEARKAIYNNAAARAIKDSNNYRDQLAASLSGGTAAPIPGLPGTVLDVVLDRERGKGVKGPDKNIVWGPSFNNPAPGSAYSADPDQALADMKRRAAAQYPAHATAPTVVLPAVAAQQDAVITSNAPWSAPGSGIQFSALNGVQDKNAPVVRAVLANKHAETLKQAAKAAAEQSNSDEAKKAQIAADIEKGRKLLAALRDRTDN